MKQLFSVAASLLLIGTAAAVSAKDLALPRELPPYGVDKPVPVPQIDKHTLANGMTLWIVADKEGVPKVNYVLAVRGGSAADPRELNGLSSIMAGTLDEGTRSRSSIQIAQELQGLGASLDSSPGQDGTTVAASGLSSSAKPLMELLADVVRNPTFPDHEIELAKSNALQELKAAQSTPGYYAGIAFGAAVFGDHPYGTGEPTEASIAAVSPRHARDLHSKRFRPDRALLVVSGRVDAVEIARLAQANFGDWKAAGQPEAAIPPAPREAAPARLFVPRAGSVQSSIRIGRPAFAAADPVLPKTDVARAIIGGGFMGRLFKNLREDKGYTYGAYAAFSTFRMGGAFQARADVRNEVTGAAVREFNKELQRMVDEPVDADELTRGQRYLAGVYLYRNQMRGSVARTLAGLWIDGRAPEELGEYVGKIKAVTAADVQAVAKQYFDPTRQTIVVEGDPSVADQLKPYGEFRSAGR